jgi:von Willebrand factor type A domain
MRFVLLVLGVAGCGSDSVFKEGADPSGGYSTSATAASDPSGAGSDTTTTDPGQNGGAGTLTAGAWDDNLNYDWFSLYLDEQGQVNGAPTLDNQERDVAQQLFGAVRDPNADLDVVLLFDTTGSMGDELVYLTAEVESIAEDIEAVAPSADVRWGMVVYRDEGDLYVTKSFDFTSDLQGFQQDLAAQRASGGGDYPEASEQGLADALDLQWRTAPDVARLVFWIADAPHHQSRAGAITEEIRRAAEDDVHLYPVAASGADELAELTMRSAAQLTGGRYLFLTDDSGIGGEHKEPTIPCYFVTTLRDAMVRMVDIEMSGVYHEPDPEQILRTGGDPQDGACTLDDGTEVQAF